MTSYQKLKNKYDKLQKEMGNLLLDLKNWKNIDPEDNSIKEIYYHYLENYLKNSEE